MRWVKVGLTYVGAIVGAGFASGQEIHQFFSRYGPWGTLGIVLAGVMFFLIGWRALEQGRRGAVNLSAGRGSLGNVVTGVTLAFLLAGLAVVLAGGGATLHQLVGMPVWMGATLTLLVIMAVVFRGAHFVMWVNTLVVPYLMTLTMLVAIVYVPRGTPLVTPHHWWALSAVLYVSYNVFTAVLVLFTLGRSLPSRRSSGLAAFLGAFVLTGMALLEHRVLLGLPVVGALPLLEAAEHTHPTLGILFGISLWAALFTTGVAEAFAFAERVGSRWRFGLMGVLPLSFWGFQGMVATLYPLMGGIGVVIWAPLLKRSKHYDSL